MNKDDDLPFDPDAPFVSPPPPRWNETKDAFTPAGYSMSIEGDERVVFRFVDDQGKIVDLALHQDMALRLQYSIIGASRVMGWLENKGTLVQ